LSANQSLSLGPLCSPLLVFFDPGTVLARTICQPLLASSFSGVGVFRGGPGVGGGSVSPPRFPWWGGFPSSYSPLPPILLGGRRGGGPLGGGFLGLGRGPFFSGFIPVKLFLPFTFNCPHPHRRGFWRPFNVDLRLVALDVLFFLSLFCPGFGLAALFSLPPRPYIFLP